MCQDLPHRMPGEGHFLALLEKSGEDSRPGQENLRTGKRKAPKLPDCAEEFLSLLSYPIDRENLKLDRDRLYLLPGRVEVPSCAFLRTGLYLGDVKKNRFEPSQALAMLKAGGICLLLSGWS